MENIQISCALVDGREDIALIKLNPQVLGGHDALAFTSIIQDLGTKPLKAVVADLSGVIVMNSSGLGMLVSGLSSLRKYNIPFLLLNVPDKVNNLLDVTHLNKVFKMYDNLEEIVSNY